MSTTELLQQLNDDVKDIVLAIKADFIHLPTETLNRKRTTTSWSALECFEHLNRYNAYYISAIEKALQAAGDHRSKEIRSTWIGKKSIGMMHPSNVKKQKTFKKMDPANSNVSRNVIDQLFTDQERLQSLLTTAITKDVNTKNVPVEFFKLLKMTIAEALEFIVVHEQRHLKQAQAALHN